MIKAYTRPQTPESFKRPYITIDGDTVTLRFTMYGVTFEQNFESVKEANDYARANDIDNLPNAEFYD